MEISDDNLQTLGKYLYETLNPDVSVRRNAEKFLEGVEVNQNYPVLLLNLVHREQTDMLIRTAGAIAFKNYIKRNWTVVEDQIDRIHVSDRAAIKSLIVTIMLSAPDSIQKQLSDAISIIGKTDFPTKWPELITEMVVKFATGDFKVINGILRTAHSLFKKYRFEFKSNELWTEIKFVLEKLAQPLTDLLVATANVMQANADNVAASKMIFSSLVLISKIFYSLNFQDLPEFFEDNMEVWMNHFHVFLNIKQPNLATTGIEEAGVVELLKSQICDNVGLYAQKYDEEFQKYLPQFVSDVWSLLSEIGLEPKFDLLVSNALQFLSTVAERNHYRNLFEDPNVLRSLCEKVVIPNMEFRVTDQELFEDNPEEYTRRDIEGSDVDTRRRAACDLLNTLSVQFESNIMEICGQYLQVMLSKYVENPKENWRSKDTALYLVISLVSRGSTQKHGVTQTSQLVNISQFCQQQILPELERPDVNDLPVLKADAIKYVMTFRSVLPSAVVVSTLPQLVRHLESESAVVHTYSACAIEKMLIMKTSDNQPIVSGRHLQPCADKLISGLLDVLDRPVSEENEYVMKALMRSFSTLQELVIPYLSIALPKLTEKLHQVTKNPSRPHFNHYLFETFSLSVRIVCKSNPSAVTSFEDILFPIFQGILQQDVQEFIPYVFQVLSLLLDFTSPQVITEPYIQLLPCLLAPVLWERPANINPLVRLLRSLISHASSQIVEQQKLPGFLGVFQKLIASKSNDHEGFYLMQGLITHCPQAALQPYFKQIFILLFQRLSSSKTTKYVIHLIVFFSLYMIKFSPNDLMLLIDEIQNDMFGMVLEKLFVSEIQKVNGQIDRRIVACGIINLLCRCPELFNGKYVRFWPQLLHSLIMFFELPPDESTFPDDHFIEVDDTPSYQTSNAKLNFANANKEDPVANIGEPREFLVRTLQQLGKQNPGRIPTLVSNIPTEGQNVLQQYLTKYGVQLV